LRARVVAVLREDLVLALLVPYIHEELAVLGACRLLCLMESRDPARGFLRLSLDRLGGAAMLLCLRFRRLMRGRVPQLIEVLCA
jgi:hypothetical protein